MRRAWIGFVLLVVVVAAPIVIAQATDAAAPLNHPDTAEWSSVVVWAWLSSSFMEWVKKHRTIAIISDQTAWGAQRLLAIVLASATSLGIHISFEPAMGVLTVTGLLWPSVMTGVWETTRQFVLQEIMYRASIKGKTGGDV
jgi:hypothetical protein